MKIAYIAAGAGGMYCGSCIHDNTVASALQRMGHDVALVPTYTPMRTDEPAVAEKRVFYGALNVFLQQKVPFFRRTPRFFDRLLDQPRLLSWISKLGASTDPSQLGDLTLSTLRGEEGRQAKEVDKLVDWLADDHRPDLVHVTNSMFLGLVRRLKQELGVPVVVAVQGEDLFLDSLPDDVRAAAYRLMADRASEADGFIAPSRYYAELMADRLQVPLEKVHVVPLGIRLGGHGAAPADQRPGDDAERGQRLGYFARICPEKGFHQLIEAFRILAERPEHADLELAAAGYLGPGDRAFFDEQTRRLADWGLADRFEHVGEVDLEGKIAFLSSLDVFSVPTVYREPKGLFLLEALANGVPAVQPRHGSFPELLEATGGGLLVEPGSPQALADGIAELLLDADKRRTLGRQGRESVHRDRHDDAMAAATLAVYERIAGRAGAPEPALSSVLQ